MDQKIQKLKQKAINMINFIESERTKEQFPENNDLKTMLKNRMPDLDQRLWNMHNEIFDFDKTTKPTTKLRKMNKNKLWKDLVDFTRGIRYFYCFYYRKSKAPQRMRYNPRQKKSGLEFTETFFQKLETELNADFKQKIDEMSFITIQQAEETLQEWKEITLMQNKQEYGEKLSKIYGFLDFLRGNLISIGCTHHQIRLIENQTNNS